ncbi:MAG: hypothetical protein RR855_20050 [Comamonas sp.]
MHTQPLSPSTRHAPSLPLRAALLGTALAWGLAAHSTAQERSASAVAQTTPAAGHTPAPAAAPAGRTRAEVIAELECARASGELDAMVLRSYGLPTPPLRPEACAAGTTARAAPSPQAARQAPQPGY